MDEFYSLDQLKDLEEGWWFYDHAWSLLHTIIKSIEGSSILDVGCGTGLALSVIQSINPERECIGIEPTEGFSEFWKLRNLNIKRGNALSIPLENNSIDFVYSSHVIEHVDDHATCVREMIRVAKKKVLIIVPEGDCDDKNLGSPHLRVYDRKNFKELVSISCGDLDEVEIKHHAHPHINSLIAEIKIG